MRIFFIGYIEAGKKKWGQKLAKELNYKFIDTRDLMQEKTGKSYKELLHNKVLFINTEQEIIDEIIELENVVIAVSELMPCRNNNIEILNNSGITIYLRAGLGCIMMKVSKIKNDIPLLQNVLPDIVPDFVNAELQRRKPYYKKSKFDVLARELTMTKLLKLISN